MPYFSLVNDKKEIIITFGSIQIVDNAENLFQICVLIGCGCVDNCPYMVFELAKLLLDEGAIKHYLTNDVLYDNYAAAADHGISKVMAKMVLQGSADL